MADTGNKAGSFAHAAISATPVDGTAVADSANVTTDAIDNSKTLARVGTVVSIGLVEDNTGAITGTVTVGIFGSDLDPDSEGFQTATDPFWQFVMTPIQNAEVISAPFLVAGEVHPNFKVYLANDSGQELAITINLVPITVPVAS